MLFKFNIPEAKRGEIERISERGSFAMDRKEYEDERDKQIVDAVKKVLSKMEYRGGVEDYDRLYHELYFLVGNELSPKTKLLDKEEYPTEKIVETIKRLLATEELAEQSIGLKNIINDINKQPR